MRFISLADIGAHHRLRGRKNDLILGLIPQLPKEYRLALLKNKFGDVEVDTQLASQSAISGVRELLNGCICRNLVGQLGDALEALRKDVCPDRIIIETSGSAFPATLAMEVNRLGRETGRYTLDGVVVVIDVENWRGYEDTSHTARMQARYKDLIVFNKWDLVNERCYEDCLDRLGDLELQVATVKSKKGHVDSSVLLGLDGALAKISDPLDHSHPCNEHESKSMEHDQNEFEVLSVGLFCGSPSIDVNLEFLETLLLSAPKDEIYRIEGIIKASRPPASSGGDVEPAKTNHGQNLAKYILNWAFGRWVFVPLDDAVPYKDDTLAQNHETDPVVQMPEGLKNDPLVRLTVILARREANKWKTRIKTQGHIEPENDAAEWRLQVERIL